MPRYNLNQQEQKSCGGACAAVVLAELGLAGVADHTLEMQIYNLAQRGVDQESAPSRIANHLSSRGLRVWIMESPATTLALLVGSRGALLGPWSEYCAEIWRDWAWRYWRGLKPGDFDDNARAMLVCIIADGSNLTHFILARRDAGHYWVMNPDGGSDTQDDDLFTFLNTIGHQRRYGGVPYVYTGICIWISPANARWWGRL